MNFTIQENFAAKICNSLIHVFFTVEVTACQNFLRKSYIEYRTICSKIINDEIYYRSTCYFLCPAGTNSALQENIPEKSHGTFP